MAENPAKRIGTGMAALAAITALTACGGDGTATAPPNPQHFQGKNDGIFTRISGAATSEEATALTATTVGINYERDRTATLADPEEISVRIFRTAPGSVPTVELARGDDAGTFGPEHALEDGRYRVRDGDDRRDLWAWSGQITDHANGWRVNDEGERRSLDQRYLIPFGFWWDGGENADSHSFAVIGLHTPPGDMPTHDVTASYVGDVRIDTWEAEDNQNQRQFGGDLVLEADFADGTISGTLDDWWEQMQLDGRRFEQDLDDSFVYLIPETRIDGNGFSGTLVAAPGCADCFELTSSAIEGGFYGPYAEESGGTLQGEFTLDGSDHVMNGIFYANR